MNGLITTNDLRRLDSSDERREWLRAAHAVERSDLFAAYCALLVMYKSFGDIDNELVIGSFIDYLFTTLSEAGEDVKPPRMLMEEMP